MNKNALFLAIVTLGCNATEPTPQPQTKNSPPGKTSISETIEPTGAPTEKEVDYSSGPPERVFQCTRPADVVSDPVGVAADDDNIRFEIRYAKDCQSTLWVNDGAGWIVLDTRERLYTVASAVMIDTTRVACFGVINLGAAASFAEGTGHHIDSTQVDCATLDPSGWTTPTPILSTTDHGTWLLGLEQDGSGKPLMVTLRDSLFSPAVMTMRGRPATDGFWQQELSLLGGAIQLGKATQRAPMQFQQK